MRKSLAILILSAVALAFSTSDAPAQWRTYNSGFKTYSTYATPYGTWNSGYSGSVYYGNNYYYNSGYTLPSYGYYSNYNYTPNYWSSGTFYPTYNHPTFRNAGYPRYGWRGW